MRVELLPARTDQTTAIRRAKVYPRRKPSFRLAYPCRRWVRRGDREQTAETSYAASLPDPGLSYMCKVPCGHGAVQRTSSDFPRPDKARCHNQYLGPTVPQLRRYEELGLQVKVKTEVLLLLARSASIVLRAVRRNKQNRFPRVYRKGAPAASPG